MAEVTKKADRRIQRTRELLRQALMSLIVERGYEAITIQDITERANVARTTFYLHFRDKDELLFQTMRDVYEEIAARVDAHYAHLLQQGVPDQADASDFQHIADFAAFYKIMLSERGSAAFLVRVRSYLAEMIQKQVIAPIMPPNGTPNLPPDLVGYLIAGMQIAAYYWWLQHDMQPSAQTMAQWVQDYCLHGVLWALAPKP
jgi:AcrR family transcriptional regulator